jgi:hypothetical protein
VALGGAAVWQVGAAILADYWNARAPTREVRPATRAPTTRRIRARDAGLDLLLQAPLRGRGGHPILRGMRS